VAGIRGGYSRYLNQGSFACYCYASGVPLTILPLTKENAAPLKNFFGEIAFFRK